VVPEPKFPPAGKVGPFSVDSDEGREVVVEVRSALLEAGVSFTTFPCSECGGYGQVSWLDEDDYTVWGTCPKCEGGSQSGFVDGETPTFRLRLTNEEAANLLVLLDAEIGDWKRERDSVLRAFQAGEGSLSVEERAAFGLEVEDEGFGGDDPKSEGYAENLRDLADFSRKRERESR
jgi:hypothetical protein